MLTTLVRIAAANTCIQRGPFKGSWSLRPTMFASAKHVCSFVASINVEEHRPEVARSADSPRAPTASATDRGLWSVLDRARSLELRDPDVVSPVFGAAGQQPPRLERRRG